MAILLRALQCSARSCACCGNCYSPHTPQVSLAYACEVGYRTRGRDNAMQMHYVYVRNLLHYLLAAVLCPVTSSQHYGGHNPDCAHDGKASAQATSRRRRHLLLQHLLHLHLCRSCHVCKCTPRLRAARLSSRRLSRQGTQLRRLRRDLCLGGFLPRLGGFFPGLGSFHGTGHCGVLGRCKLLPGIICHASTRSSAWLRLATRGSLV